MQVEGFALGEEQRIIVDWSKKGKNFFFTGNAGTGKTVTLIAVINGLRALLGSEAVAVSASTGTAANLIGGQTIHSWAGVGLAAKSRYQLVENIRANKTILDRWITVKAIVIDEILLVTADLFDKLEFIARSVKGVNLPFGGIQLILSGDFHQLPPFLTAKAVQAETFCFTAHTWSRCIPLNIKLQQVWRQKYPEYLLLLDGIRRGGDLNPTTLAILSLITKADNNITDPISKTWLYSKKRRVEEKTDNFLIMFLVK